jgi:hypothetical protein
LRNRGHFVVLVLGFAPVLYDHSNNPTNLAALGIRQKYDLSNKILIFNTRRLVDFSTGDAILPTRITCYCRYTYTRGARP